MSLGKTHMFDAGANPPRKVQYKVGGRIVEGKAPNGRTQKWVDPAGNVVLIQLSDGSAPTFNGREYKIQTAKRAGYMVYAECPLRTGELNPSDVPENLRQVCPVGSHGEGKACPHVEWVIVERRKDHEEKQASRLQKSVTEIEREQREREIEAMREGMAKVAGAISTQVQQQISTGTKGR